MGIWFYKGTYNQGQDEHTGHFYHPNPPPSLMMTGFSTSPDEPAGATYSPVSSPYVTPTFSSIDEYYWVELPMYATRIDEWREAFGACLNMLESHIDVKVPDLVKMSTAPYYILYNFPATSQYHPEVHWGTKAFITELSTIANEYHTAFPKAKLIRINHMSLPWGGKFDLKLGWGVDPNEKHQGHKYGVEGDISKKDVPIANRKKLLEIICKTSGFVLSEGDSTGEDECYHIRSKTAALEYPFVNFDEDIGDRMVKCCSGSELNQANLQTCISDPPPHQ